MYIQFKYDCCQYRLFWSAVDSNIVIIYWQFWSVSVQKQYIIQRLFSKCKVVLCNLTPYSMTLSILTNVNLENINSHEIFRETNISLLHSNATETRLPCRNNTFPAKQMIKIGPFVQMFCVDIYKEIYIQRNRIIFFVGNRV